MKVYDPIIIEIVFSGVWFYFAFLFYDVVEVSAVLEISDRSSVSVNVFNGFVKVRIVWRSDNDAVKNGAFYF